jgi:hypothetical protein
MSRGKGVCFVLRLRSVEMKANSSSSRNVKCASEALGMSVSLLPNPTFP